MPEPVKLESVPPLTVMSDSVKSEEGTERVKVIAAVSPALSDSTSDFRATPGGLRSTVELLVAAVLLRDVASLPWLSWMALLSSELPGSV